MIPQHPRDLIGTLVKFTVRDRDSVSHDHCRIVGCVQRMYMRMHGLTSRKSTLKVPDCFSGGARPRFGTVVVISSHTAPFAPVAALSSSARFIPRPGAEDEALRPPQAPMRQSR
ncbi:hypothetical protein M3I54_42915 [Paraburkholderia sp. CNPSo 3274]|uniref:hypothetical protein n=1 Tax=Paraburkholderia sp. CNPSo 3274 TaxID=2940932 RepID=UPI0020B6B482|nr:hypothetical protein [Paraburkholderia sp. CNPSo 3274]MCP3713514.1 hypothetical protein [Paraburkholderia sp. CNPSo 3274]